MTTLYLVRHGQSEGNDRHICAGGADIPLSDLGRAQAELAAGYLAKKQIDAAYSSPLSRAFETARIISRAHGIEAVPVPELREMSCGEWEEKTYEDIIRLYPEDYAVWQSAIHKARPKGGENPFEVYERVSKKLMEIAKRHDGQSVLVVTHAIVLRTLICSLKFGSLEKMTELKFVPNASTTRVVFAHGKFSLEDVGYDKYLGDMSTTLVGL